ncbi:MAG TPA: hypothetical protein VGM95_04865 [Lactobacillaceae bacterium]|jgi:hypothetical protein
MAKIFDYESTKNPFEDLFSNLDETPDEKAAREAALGHTQKND